MVLCRSLRYLSLALAALVFAPDRQPAAAADENAELLPRLGETTTEFEARTRGLASPASPSSVTLVADPLGHFLIETIVNGSRLRMMVDTGASLVMLSRDDARLIGINPAPSDFRVRVMTANGPVLVAPAVIKEVTVGGLSVRDVQGAVFPDNKLQVGLLGMSFLSKLSHFEVAGGRLVLRQ